MADAAGDHHLWLRGGDALERPAVLLPLDDDFTLRIEALLRLYRRLEGRASSPTPRALQLTPLRRTRLIQMLHALDYRLAGVGPRAIAAALLDRDAAALRAVEWKSSALRRRVMRLITDGKNLMDGGYLKLLRGE